MRPTIAVVEPEPIGALSARKLVLEAAKFNVITAHSTEEAMECFDAFPRVSAAVLVAQDAIACEKLTRYVKEQNPKLPVIVLSPRVGFQCVGADHLISSRDPGALLELARKLFGDPREIDPSPR